MPNNNISQSGIFFSCTEKSFLVKEHTVPVHVLTHIYSGKLLVKEADKSYLINEGETVLFAKNQLAKITKYPSDDQPFKSISIFFTQDFLQQYYTLHLKAETTITQPKVLLFNKHPLLDSLYNSILPYYEMAEGLPQALLSLKLTEAMTIIRQISHTVDGILTDFAEPGKIDLAEYMQKNFSFNIPTEQFAYLTGRSLASFKRDFQKKFNTSPQKWLVQKRLEQAHYLIAERKQKPSEVYLEVGFENLSHFSYAFKQFFGYNPSSISLSFSANNL